MATTNSWGDIEYRILRNWVDEYHATTTSSVWGEWTTTTSSTSSTADTTWYTWQDYTTTTSGLVTIKPRILTPSTDHYTYLRDSTTRVYGEWVQEEVKQERKSRDQLAANRGDVSVAVRALQREQEELRRRELAATMQRKTNQRRKADALDRSMLLLRQACNDDQIRDLEETGSLIVVGRSGTRYRVTDKGSVANVHVLDRNNKVTHRLCAHPVGVPQGDIMLAQKLMLEHDEDAFVRKANRHLAVGY